MIGPDLWQRQFCMLHPTFKKKIFFLEPTSQAAPCSAQNVLWVFRPTLQDLFCINFDCLADWIQTWEKENRIIIVQICEEKKKLKESTRWTVFLLKVLVLLTNWRWCWGPAGAAGNRTSSDVAPERLWPVHPQRRRFWTTVSVETQGQEGEF